MAEWMEKWLLQWGTGRELCESSPPLARSLRLHALVTSTLKECIAFFLLCLPSWALFFACNILGPAEMAALISAVPFIQHPEGCVCGRGKVGLPSMSFVLGWGKGKSRRILRAVSMGKKVKAELTILPQPTQFSLFILGMSDETQTYRRMV